ncbi:MAG: methylmalonyl-CoA mutase family protein [Desulfomicrobium escambiense]|nr:methylmalonyl-CoA mutase family protein [Desulfomicrobium escambiense]
MAKFRAARRHVGADHEGALRRQGPASRWMLRFHTQTAGSTLTAQQPDNNVVRVTIQALAAVLGGTQSLHTNSCDEALALPTEDVGPHRPAHPADHRLRDAASADTVDPLAGSYYVEALTDEIEARRLDYIDKIDELGGAGQGHRAAATSSRRSRTPPTPTRWTSRRGERVVVGLNKFQVEEAARPKACCRSTRPWAKRRWRS